MGNCNFKADKDKETVAGKTGSSWSLFGLTMFFIAISKNHFQFQFAIGRGGFGKVWRVERKKEKEVFAMKEMMKSRVMAKKSVNSVMNELKLLAHIRNP